MCKVLILDDDVRFAKSLQPVVNRFEGNGSTTSDIASTLDEALDLAKTAIQTGEPYTVFLVDQRLGAGMDGIAAMGELRKVSPTSDAIIFTGIEDPEVGIRAYRAGAFRYLTKPIEVEELSFVLHALLRSRREDVENKWRKVFSEMMETALHYSAFPEVARVVVDHSIQLGFKRAQLFWAPWQGDTNQRNMFVGIACSGHGCIPSLSKSKFDLHTKPAFAAILRSRDAVLIQAYQNEQGAEFRSEMESIGLEFPASGCWVLPLWSGQELLGAMLLDFGETFGHLSTHERTLLDFFARQVAVTLEHAAFYGKEKRTSEEMQLLQRASVAMLRIANRSEDALWMTVLTIATANFGLGFNRALFFLKKDNEPVLVGCAAVGDNDTQGAMRAWELDEARNYDFDSFLRDIAAGRVEPTPLHAFIHGKEIPIADFGHRIGEVLLNGGITGLSEQEALDEFPASIRTGFTPARCALLPLQVGSQILGLVVVDNKHNNLALNWKSLEHLRTLLVNVGLVWETRRQRARSEDLLEANYEILGGAGHRTLQQTLSIICTTARKYSQASWAIIFPIRKTSRSPFYEFDLEEFGFDGKLKSIDEMAGRQPEISGVSMNVLHKGQLIVDDLDQENPDLAEFRLYESHFIKRENVKALIGIAIKDPYTSDPLGILYLDYLQPHTFTEMEIRHANSFARLAAVAISNSRNIDEQHQRGLLNIVLGISETIGSELNIEEILAKGLESLQLTFEKTTLCVLLYDEDEKALKFAPRTLQYYKITNPEFQSLRVFPLDEKRNGSIACKVARKSLASHHREQIYVEEVKNDPDYLALNPNTTSELCVSLMDSSGELLGVLALEREESSFDRNHIALVETAAHQLGQAIERSQRSERLAFKETVATMTSWASDIAHDINSEVGLIRGNAYLVRLLTENEEIVQYVDEIDTSAAKLISVGPWSTQAKKEIGLDVSLRGFLEPLVSQRNVKLELNLCTPDAYIKVNPNEFQHVLRHLVRNSARAMESFPGTKEKKISISTQYLPDGRTEILFQDYGPGIDDEVRAAIFQRKTTTKPTTGGYGLLISRQLVDDMGGKITLLPAELDQGATFSIKLPVVASPAELEVQE